MTVSGSIVRKVSLRYKGLFCFLLYRLLFIRDLLGVEIIFFDESNALLKVSKQKAFDRYTPMLTFCIVLSREEQGKLLAFARC